jgi:hypothetical protein
MDYRIIYFINHFEIVENDITPVLCYHSGFVGILISAIIIH